MAGLVRPAPRRPAVDGARSARGHSRRAPSADRRIPSPRASAESLRPAPPPIPGSPCIRAEGFNFEPGFFQKLKISEEHLDKTKVPADGSSIKYKLVKKLDKKFDQRIILNDIWIANRINKNPINNIESLPQMEINLAKMQVLGHNGCNNFNGGIERITASDIQFGKIASTRKMCLDMVLPDLFDKAMSASATYKIAGTSLTFFDKEHHETIHFTKVD